MSITNLLNGILGGIAGFVDDKDTPKAKPSNKNKGFYKDPQSSTGFSYKNSAGKKKTGVAKPSYNEKVLTDHGRIRANEYYHNPNQYVSSPSVVNDWAAFQAPQNIGQARLMGVSPEPELGGAARAAHGLGRGINLASWVLGPQAGTRRAIAAAPYADDVLYHTPHAYAYRAIDPVDKAQDAYGYVRDHGPGIAREFWGGLRG